MKPYTIILLVLIISSCSEKKENQEELKSFWSIEKETSHLLNRQDSSTWDMDMLKSDKEYQTSATNLPFESGVFPTPMYDLIGEGSFQGVGNYGLHGGDDSELKLGDKTILYNSFFVGASEVNRAFIADRKNEVFFQIIVLTDFVDTLNYSHLKSEVVSRNHPHYIGQGFYKTKESTIDYSAFITADQNSYAIVNMRLFDLSFGKTILIAPQKDQSFRSLQIQSPKLSKEEIEEYTNSLMRQQDVIDFFTQEGNI